MKTLAERGREPRQGFIAKCGRCGALVVHAFSTGKPFHMHARSARCLYGKRLDILRGKK